jgi:hypothetical protein
MEGLEGRVNVMAGPCDLPTGSEQIDFGNTFRLTRWCQRLPRPATTGNTDKPPARVRGDPRAGGAARAQRVSAGVLAEVDYFSSREW